MRRLMVLLMVGPLLAVVACLRTLPHNDGAAGVALAAGPPLQMPPHDGRPHWLLRQEPGWVGAYRVDFGGREEDRALTIIRVALFADAATASAAFARLTPAFTHKLWGAHMLEAPHAVTYPFTIAGDEVRTMEYPPRPDPRDEERDEELTEQLIVQLFAVRAGRVVAVVESIGIPREELPPVVATLVRAAAGLPPADD